MRAKNSDYYICTVMFTLKRLFPTVCSEKNFCFQCAVLNDHVYSENIYVWKHF